MSGQPWGSNTGSTRPGGPSNVPRPSSQWGQFPPAGRFAPSSPDPSFGQSAYGGSPFRQSPYGPSPHGPSPHGTAGPPAGGNLPTGPGPWPGGSTRKTSRLGRILLVVTGLAVAALVGLVLVGLTRPGEVAYVNEGYTPPPADSNPPPLPQPGSEQEAIDLTSANPVYDQVLPAPVRCDGVEPVDVESISDDDLEVHLNNLMGCLVAAWHAPLEAAGFQLPRPPVTVHTDDTLVTTACGETQPGNASYCSADQAIYYSSDLPDHAPFLLDARYGVESVLAHEFGHALQGRTGILLGRNALAGAAETEDEAYELVRRNEAQADCLAGLFVRSAARSLAVDAAEYENLATIYEKIGGPQADPGSTHPYGPSRTYWFRTGIATDAIGSCNTYTAPSEHVR